MRHDWFERTRIRGSWAAEFCASSYRISLSDVMSESTVVLCQLTRCCVDLIPRCFSVPSFVLLCSDLTAPFLCHLNDLCHSRMVASPNDAPSDPAGFVFGCVFQWSRVHEVGRKGVKAPGRVFQET
jgi:hypothetical protein